MYTSSVPGEARRWRWIPLVGDTGGCEAPDLDVRKTARAVNINCLSLFIPRSVHRRHKRALDPLELELQMSVSHHVSVGNQTQALCKRSNCS